MVGGSGKPEGDAGRQQPGPAPPPAGFLIRRLREKALLTQDEVARELGMNRKTYNGLECGRTDLTSPMACEIGELLQADPFELMAAQVRLDRWRRRTGQVRHARRKGREHGDFGSTAPAG